MTVLFADVVGSTSLAERMDPEDWSALIGQGIEVMSGAIQRYDGTIAQISGDGILAFFGAPVAHEDDPERAILAGLDMVADVRRFAEHLRKSENIEFEVRVGINTGPVVVATLELNQAREYTAFGDAVNVAARIQAAARPGSVFITESTHRFVRGRFDVREVGPLSLKGKAEPVWAFEVIGPLAAAPPARGLAGLRAPLIGRQETLATLEDALEAAQEGGGSAVFLLGEPGIGKSRLLQEFRARALAGPLLWAEGRCLSHGRVLPYHLLMDLVRSMLALPLGPEDAVAKLRSRLRDLVPEGWEGIHASLGHLLSLPLDSAATKRIQALQPPARHDGYLSALRSVVEALTARSPVALVCEDLHWADPSSVEALQDLVAARPATRLLLMCSSRPEPESPVWRILERAREALGPGVVEIRLEPLSGDDSRSLLATLLEIESLGADLQDLVLGKAEGNPFFLEEVVRMLIDHGVIRRSGQRWEATGQGPPASVPETLHGLLLARVDALPAEARRAARVASVIGRRFEPEVVARLLERDIVGSLERLEVAGIVSPADGGYEFRHALIQEAAYDSVLKRDRLALHRRVAEVLESLYPERRSELAAELALHFERAGDTDRAIDLLLEAGEYALARFATREAWELFERLESHVVGNGKDPERLRALVLARLGRVRAGFTFVPYGESVGLLEEVLPVAEGLGDRRLEAETHLWVSRIRHMQGDDPGFSRPLQQSLDRLREIAEALGDDQLRALPLAMEGLSQFGASNFRPAVMLLGEAVPMLERFGDLKEAAYHAGILALSHARLGEFAEAELWAARASELAARSGDPNARIDADIHAGMVANERGDLERSSELVRRGVELAQETDNKVCMVVGHFVIGDNELRAGRPELAIDSLTRSSDVARYCHAVDVENLSRAWLGRARAMLGQAERSLPALEESIAQAREMGDRLAEAEVLRHRAVVRAGLPQPDWGAVELDFETALSMFRELEARPYEARALRDYGLTLQASGRTEDGMENVRRAVAKFEEMGIVTEQPSGGEGIAS